VAERISWILGVEIGGGPTASATDTMLVDAYDKVQADIAAAADKLPVDVQPASSGVKLLSITSTVYDPKLTFSVNAEEASENKRIKLDGPMLLVGEGSVGLLGPTPKRLFFYNKTNPGQDAAVSIIVGRALA
jgi:hypothetical protein